MLSQSQYLTPERGRQNGMSGLRDAMDINGMSPKSPQELFGLGSARSPVRNMDEHKGYVSGNGGDTPLLNSNYPPSPYSQQHYNMVTDPSNAGFTSPQQTSTWSSRAEYALNAPTIFQKCSELGPVLTSCPVKELQTIWKTTVERIFSLGGGRGWGISTTQRSQNPREYQAIASFLSSTGPVLTACHKLLADPYIRYEFPVSRLSSSLVNQITNGQLCSFLGSRLSPGMQQLSLNSFEYYMFTFAVYIVQPYTMDNKLVAGESLYPYILEDYLSYYLPCDGTTPPPLPFQLTLPSSPGKGLSPIHQQSEQTSCSPQTTSTRKSLLRHPSLLSPSAASTRSAPAASPPPVTTIVPSKDQTWSSETVLTIFTNVWLTQFSRSTNSPTRATNSELLIPVSDTLKIVRMLIKHLHYFANSGGPSDIIPLDQLKRSTLPSVKQQMYKMFKYIFGLWPHDSSFRLVLETWLSFIQPWRYTDRGRPVADSDPAPVESKWQSWVAENILLYSEVMRLLLPRFFRMDLTASKNAYMLFRIAKVFSQPGLVDLIKSAEVGLEKGSSSRVTMPSFLDQSTVLSEDREGIFSLAKACLLELEGQGTRYSPIFGNEFRQQVAELLATAERAKLAASDMLKEMGASKTNVKSEFTLVGFIQWLFGGTNTNQDTQETEELKKTVQHLSASLDNMTDIFGLALPRVDELDNSRTVFTFSKVTNGPEMMETDNGLVLTPHGRWQVVQGIAKPNVRYEGDPDLSPITHGEVVWLVRLLYQISLWLNKHYDEQLQLAWRRPGVLGRITRAFLHEPKTFFSVTKSIDGGPAKRQMHRHNARISLRLLARKQLLFYVCVWSAFCWLFFGYSFQLSVFILVMLVFCYITVKSLFQHLTQPVPSLLDTSDIVIEEIDRDKRD